MGRIKLNPWMYKGVEINSVEDMPEGTIAIIYEMTHIPTGSKYIGRRGVMKLTTKYRKNMPPEKVLTPAYGNWKTYKGSNVDFKQLTHNCKPEDIHREILCFCPTKKSITFNELKYQIMLGVLEKKEYLNANILGKFFYEDTKTLLPATDSGTSTEDSRGRDS